MGLLSLSNFRDELGVVFGERGIGDTTLDRWLNFGYFEVATAIDFEILDDDLQISATTGTKQYSISSIDDDAIAYKMLRDETQDITLERVVKIEFFRRGTGTTQGTPEIWTVHGSDVYVYPVPDGAYTLQLTYKKKPAALSADADVTILHAGWDQAIIYFAASHGYMMLGEEQRAAFWFNRGATYTKSRLIEGDFPEAIVGLKMPMPQGGFSGPANPQ